MLNVTQNIELSTTKKKKKKTVRIIEISTSACILSQFIIINTSTGYLFYWSVFAYSYTEAKKKKKNRTAFRHLSKGLALEFCHSQLLFCIFITHLNSTFTVKELLLLVYYIYLLYIYNTIFPAGYCYYYFSFFMLYTYKKFIYYMNQLCPSVMILLLIDGFQEMVVDIENSNFTINHIRGQCVAYFK